MLLKKGNYPIYLVKNKNSFKESKPAALSGLMINFAISKIKEDTFVTDQMYIEYKFILIILHFFL